MFQRSSAKPLHYRALFSVERWTKELLLGCHSCGQCAARSTALVCPMQCPKQLRNGPCGGSENGHCEVYPERKCVWVRIMRRAERLGKLDVMSKPIPAIDWSLYGTSAWANLFIEKKIDGRGRPLSPSPWMRKYGETYLARGGNEE